MNKLEIAAVQRLRLLRTCYAMAGAIAFTCVIAMLFFYGHTRLSPMGLALGTLVFWLVNLSFALMIVTNINLHFQDQTMTFAMMLWSTISSFAWIYFIVDNRHLVIMVYLLAMMLGAFRLRLRQYLQITVLALTMYAGVIAALSYNHPQQFSTSQESMNWVVLAIVMLGFSILGAEASRVSDLLRRRNRELRDARDSATIAYKAKSRFLASTSHELRTPLNTILGACEVIKDHGLPNQESDALVRANRAGLHLLSLVNSMIDLSQLESGSLEIRPERTDLCAELNTIHSMMEANAQQRCLQLNLDSNLGASFITNIDAMRLREVLVHLVHNAITHTDVGEVTLSAQLSPPNEQADETVHAILFSVLDTGRGMGVNTLSGLFSGTNSADAKLTSEQDQEEIQGPGLGLSMCQQLVTLMGGKIVGRSILGEGSEFDFTLLLPRLEDDAISPHTAKGQGSETNEQKTCRILVVDDSPDNRMLFQAFLRNQHAEVEYAEDGIQALELFVEQSFDIVLMDMHMPKMNGIDATKAIRAYENDRDQEQQMSPSRSIILAVTADDSDSDHRRSKQAGCDEHLIKPISRNALLEALRRYRPALTTTTAV